MPIPNRSDDPQITVTGKVKPTREGEMITFQFNLAWFQIVCLANIPGEGETCAPVYIKFKLRPSERKVGNRAEDKADETESATG